MAAPVLSIASTAFSFIGGQQESAALKQQGVMAQNIANAQADYTLRVAKANALITQNKAKYDAARLREDALQSEAVAQREAASKRKEKMLAISSAQARAGAGGGGTTDPTTLSILEDIEEVGTLNALNALFDGQSAASILRSQASLTEHEGDVSSAMTLYQGDIDAQLTRYGGSVSRTNYSNAATTARYKSYGGLLGDSLDIATKYKDKKPTNKTG
jgi:hypothetical protein